ncbi:MAG: carbohydrate binding domain-containing protein [Muribaculaceae bacterium]|nr:carbohydrate binding domain-containing protein [Muribaculaceae bacterium]
MKNQTLALIAAASVSWLAASAGVTMDVALNKPGADIAPTMYGLFFEDINFGADGGLYAEMVKNRSFEFPDHLMGWRSFGRVEVKDDGPFDRNPHYIRLSSAGHRDKQTGVDNEGFFGVTFKADSLYRFSVWARTPDGRPSRIKVELIDPAADGETQVCAQTTINIDSNEWRRYTATLKPGSTVTKGRLRVFLDSPVSADLEHISLFPADTWKGREGGLRRDLVELLAGVNPGVFRFPGGCIVEGTDLATRYQWKNSVGPVENRPLNENRWHYTFPHRQYPDYYQSLGLGFYEYFLLAEDMGAAPLPVISVGLVCQYQNKDASAHVPVDSLEPYIRDAVDLVEFANGDTTTQWGALRASMGHPEPFGLKYLAIGNEQWGPEYVERLEKFLEVMRRECPEIEIVGTAGPTPEGEKFDYLWPEMKRLKADLVDEHYYRPDEWFLSHAQRYDTYDRRGPKVFAGEYACHTPGHKRNNFRAALCEAAFMTGLERNADVVRMATYAPLLAHVEGWQWRPDMIWFDNLTAVPTASYYVQQLYATNRGSRVLPLTMKGQPVAGLQDQQGLYATAALDENGNCIIKLANTSDEPREVTFDFHGLKRGQSLGAVDAISISAPESLADNTLGHPDTVAPKSQSEQASGSSYTATIPAQTFTVYTIGL